MGDLLGGLALRGGYLCPIFLPLHLPEPLAEAFGAHDDPIVSLHRIARDVIAFGETHGEQAAGAAISGLSRRS